MGALTGVRALPPVKGATSTYFLHENSSSTRDQASRSLSAHEGAVTHSSFR